MNYKEGYMITFNGQKGILVKRGIFKFNNNSTSFCPYHEKNYMMTHCIMKPMEVVFETSRVFVENEEDIDKSVDLLKDCLFEKVKKLNKEYERRITNLEKAIEDEVKYEC